MNIIVSMSHVFYLCTYMYATCRCAGALIGPMTYAINDFTKYFTGDIIDICNLCVACRDNVWNIKGGMQGQFGIWMLLSLHRLQQNTTMTKVISVHV